jgi:predicted MFS family arabinose efflux permease
MEEVPTSAPIDDDPGPPLAGAAGTIEDALIEEAPPPAPTGPQPGDLTTLLLVIFAITAGLVVSNLYYMQPLLTQTATYFDITETGAGLLTTLTQAGYAIGMLFILPIADIVEKRRVVCLSLVFVTIFLILLVISANYILSLVTCFFIGLTSVSVQLLVPIAAQMAAPERRGKVVGTLIGSLIIGILLSRVFAGLLGRNFGWKTIYWIAAILIAISCGILRWQLPYFPPASTLGYLAALKSLPGLFMQYADLRYAALCGMTAFAGFQIFWTSLSFYLKDTWGWGPDIAGLFGLIGVVGAAMAQAGGWIADKWGTFAVVSAGIIISFLSFILYLTVCKWVAGVVMTVLLLDAGVQGWNTALQTIVQSLTNEARSRVTAIYIFVYFVGGSAGSLGGSALYQHYGWWADGVYGLSLIAAGGAIHFATQSRKQCRKAIAVEEDPHVEDAAAIAA